MNKLINKAIITFLLTLNGVGSTYCGRIDAALRWASAPKYSTHIPDHQETPPMRETQASGGQRFAYNPVYNEDPGLARQVAGAAWGATKSVGNGLGSLAAGALFGGGGLAGGSILGSAIGQMGSSVIAANAHKDIAKTDLKRAEVNQETEKLRIDGQKDLVEKTKQAQIDLEEVQAEQKMRVLSFEDDLKKPKYIDAIIKADAIKTTVFVTDKRVDPQISETIDDTIKGHSTEPLSMLLFGPPGTGKTSRVMKSARKMNKTLVKINTPDLFQTKTDPAVLNKQLKELLLRDDVLIYFEEGDLILMDRDILYNMNLDPRITTTILQAFSDSSERKAHAIVDSNLKDGSKFDAASLRRFHQQFYIQNPDQAMIEQLLRSYKQDLIDPIKAAPVNNRRNRIDPFSDIKIKQYARQLKGANCDHIKKAMQQIESSVKRNNGEVSQDDVNKAIARIKTNIAFAQKALKNNK